MIVCFSRKRVREQKEQELEELRRLEAVERGPNDLKAAHLVQRVYRGYLGWKRVTRKRELADWKLLRRERFFMLYVSLSRCFVSPLLAL